MLMHIKKLSNFIHQYIYMNISHLMVVLLALLLLMIYSLNSLSKLQGLNVTPLLQRIRSLS